MNKLQSLTEQLILLGEDRDEMEFWVSIYPHMDPEDRKVLIINLEQELMELKNMAAQASE